MEQLRLAGCILPDSKGKVLLLHRIKRDHWEIPGGKIDEIEDGRLVSTGRTPEETVEKEMREELTVEVDIIRKLGEREFDDNGYICHFTWYLGRVKAGSKPKIGEPHVFDDVKAFTKELSLWQCARSSLQIPATSSTPGLRASSIYCSKA
jgi:8-oxo-dGTP pyrophosphatase MutT (NUDIX family)